MADYKVIGTSQKRYDAVEKVTGAAIYSGDIKPDRMCYGRFVASPHAHANILSSTPPRRRPCPMSSAS